MGIYVPFLKKMPSRCEGCPIIDGTGCRARNPYYMDETGITRPKNCPLIELPPHGRLIDADELYALYDGEDIDDERYHVSIPCIKQNITDMPTILESDVGECITTNADYIRHMCDEKLAWWLGKICPDAPFAFAYPERSSEELWLSWLKEEEGLYE